MKREEVLSWLCSILGELLYTREFFQELVELIAETGIESKFFTTLVRQLKMLTMLGAQAVQSKEFESIGNGLFSMHLAGNGYNIRVLYSFLQNKQPILLLSFYERGGKRKTDYTKYIEPAKARLEESRKGNNHENA